MPEDFMTSSVIDLRASDVLRLFSMLVEMEKAFEAGDLSSRPNQSFSYIISFCIYSTYLDICGHDDDDDDDDDDDFSALRGLWGDDE